MAEKEIEVFETTAGLGVFTAIAGGSSLRAIPL